MGSVVEQERVTEGHGVWWWRGGRVRGCSSVAAPQQPLCGKYLLVRVGRDLGDDYGRKSMALVQHCRFCVHNRGVFV